ncbi:RIO1 family regulatory kinase/ATPase [Patescibacteria group bacterium]
MFSESSSHHGLEQEFADPAWLESIHFFETDFDRNSEIKQRIQEQLAPENFLGEGRLAYVFELGNCLCIKLMKNRQQADRSQRYDPGNTPAEEAEFLRKLVGFEHAGVKTPEVYGYYVGQRGSAIIMETMDAVDMHQALLGKEQFPEGFNYDDFFAKLSAYIDEVHTTKGIAHLDLKPANILIDRETSLPIVIDFGQARRIDSEAALRQDDPSAEKDHRMLEELVYEKLEKYFAKT